MKDHKKEAYFQAKKRVHAIKNFYGHLFWYILINISINVINWNYQEYGDFKNWLFWNLMISVFLWGIGLLIHALWVFKPKIMKSIKNISPFSSKWEQRKLKELMNNDEI